MPSEGVRDALFLSDELEHHLVGKAQADLFGVEEGPRHIGEEEKETHRVEQHDLRHKLQRQDHKGNVGNGGLFSQILFSWNTSITCKKRHTTLSAFVRTVRV